MAEKSVHASKELTLATTRWCPYTCFDERKEFGIVGIYIEKILSSHNTHLSVVSYPWSRALRLVQSKEVDGLLTATPAEAPNLLFSDSPIGSYQMCFYTVNSSSLRFDKSIDFGNNLLAVVQDYGYGEPLDSYIKKNKSITSISGSNVTDRLISLLIKGRVDVIVTDKLVVDYKIANHSIDANTIKRAGCLLENDFYLALRSTRENENLLKKINQELIQPENINYFVLQLRQICVNFMNKTARILLLALAAFFLFLGIKSSQHSKTYAELTDIQTITGTIFQLHCPPKGAASLSLTDSDLTYNLSVKFRTEYCDEKKSPVLLGKEITLQSVQVNGKFHQVYKIENKGRMLLNPDDVLSDQTSATLGLFFLAFLITALVLYKSRPVKNK